MQSESSRCEEETPSLLWGLDPVFLAFAKLYIRDILDLKESRQVPGMWLVGLVTALCCICTPPSLPQSYRNLGLRGLAEPFQLQALKLT